MHTPGRILGLNSREEICSQTTKINIWKGGRRKRKKKRKKIQLHIRLWGQFQKKALNTSPTSTRPWKKEFYNRRQHTAFSDLLCTFAVSLQHSFFIYTHKIRERKKKYLHKMNPNSASLRIKSVCQMIVDQNQKLTWTLSRKNVWIQLNQMWAVEAQVWCKLAKNIACWNFRIAREILLGTEESLWPSTAQLDCILLQLLYI